MYPADAAGWPAAGCAYAAFGAGAYPAGAVAGNPGGSDEAPGWKPTGCRYVSGLPSCLR